MDRKREIESAVADVRLEKIKQRLVGLARPELFPASDFPAPAHADIREAR